MEATESEWREFAKSAVYRDMINEFDERKALIIPKLVSGNDPIWTDDNMRGRLDELEFASSMTTDMISAFDLESGKENKEPSFMDKVFANFKQNKKGEET